jgi:hypothetical protein
VVGAADCACPSSVYYSYAPPTICGLLSSISFTLAPSWHMLTYLHHSHPT